MEPEELYKKCPPIPEYIKEEIHKLFPVYFIYQKQRNGSIKYYCTRCRKVHTIKPGRICEAKQNFLDYCVQNKKAVCPFCKAEGICKPSGRVQSLSDRMQIAIPLLRNNTVWIRVVDVYVKYGYAPGLLKSDSKNRFIYETCHTDYIFLLESGVAYQYTYRYWSNDFHFNNGSKRYYEPYAGESNYCINHWVNTQALKNSFLKYALPSRFIDFVTDSQSIIKGAYHGCDEVKYLCYLSRYTKQIEYLIKAGFEQIVKDIVYYNYNCKSVINLNAEAPHEIFRMDKNEFGQIKAVLKKPFEMYGDGIDTDYLKIKKKLKRAGLPHAHKDIEKIMRKFCSGRFKWLQIIIDTNTSFDKIERYIKKQVGIDGNADEICGRAWNELNQGLQTYKDYINECKKLNYDLSDSAVAFPKDLMDAHAKNQKRISYKANKELNAKCRKRLKSLQKCVFEWKDLIVVLPESTDDIIKEGAKLSHCVGGYAERHAKGSTTIVFIREKANPNEPCYTAEIRKDGSIQQMYGYKNRNEYRTEHFKQFKVAYQKHLYKAFSKKTVKSVLAPAV